MFTISVGGATQSKLVLEDLLVTLKDERVEMALNPATCVDEVEVATVAVVLCVTVVEGIQVSSARAIEPLPLETVVVAKARTVAASRTYFTQTVPNLIKRARPSVRVSEANKTLFDSQYQVLN